MSQFYSNKNRENDPHSLPDCEVFHLSGKEMAEMWEEENCTECINSGGGYFWQRCFPGCLPDSEPVGPYATEAEAIADCQSEYGEPINGEEN